MNRLEGKVALVTGAGGGIGRGIAMRFAGEDARVGVLDVDAAKCAAVAGEIQVQGGAALALSCDVTQEAAVQAAVEQLTAAFGIASHRARGHHHWKSRPETEATTP